MGGVLTGLTGINIARQVKAIFIVRILRCSSNLPLSNQR